MFLIKPLDAKRYIPFLALMRRMRSLLVREMWLVWCGWRWVWGLDPEVKLCGPAGVEELVDAIDGHFFCHR